MEGKSNLLERYSLLFVGGFVFVEDVEPEAVGLCDVVDLSAFLAGGDLSRSAIADVDVVVFEAKKIEGRASVLFRQVSTHTGHNQLLIFRCTNVHLRRHT